jgi:hypothetical protein
MTVPEPTPDPGSRGPLLRRASFLAAAVALTATFAVALSGIATTRGAVRPGGQAAAIAAQQRSAGDSASFRRGHCHHGNRSRSGTASPGRV